MVNIVNSNFINILSGLILLILIYEIIINKIIIFYHYKKKRDWNFQLNIAIMDVKYRVEQVRNKW